MADDDRHITIDSSMAGIRKLSEITGVDYTMMRATNRFPIIVKEPNLQTKLGKAYICDLPNGLRENNVKPEDDAVVVHWMVEAPWAHPVWHSYSIILIHLREMPDKRVTKKYFQEATHEMWIHALNPDENLNALVDTGVPKGVLLLPINFGAQIAAASDEEAAARIKTSVEEILAGTLSPDTDFRQMWVDRYGDSMVIK